MTNLSRELIQIVEIDIERCTQDYGSEAGAPYGEPDVTPDLIKADLENVLNSEVNRTNDIVAAFDVVFNEGASGVIWEQGGASNGAYLGVTSGDIIFRFGNGGVPPLSDIALASIPVAPYVGRALKVVVQIRSRENAILTIFDGASQLAEDTGTATTIPTFWSGAGNGRVGQINTSTVSGVDATDFSGTISEARFYQTDTTISGTGCRAVLGTSGVRKCYNTFFTCQSVPDFITGTETLRFAENQAGIPRPERIYPAMNGRVSTNPTRINLSGVSDRYGPLGKRARVNVRLEDFADSDIWFDRYQSERVDGTAQTDEPGYNPMGRGTFFAKLRRRFPYYIGRPLRVLEGEVGQNLADMRTRNYIISGWNGPDAGGNVEIVAKDILDLADNKKAVCPATSTGSLAVDIGEESGITFSLEPETVGEEYQTSGRASIGNEVVSFTRTGDEITLTGRALDGTEIGTHSLGDVFQQAYRVDGANLADTLQEILQDFANIDTSYIPIADWRAEVNRWLGGLALSVTIAKPTGVTRLVGELMQLGVFMWWDDIDQEIKLRVNRPLDIGETAPAISDSNTFIERSIQTSSLDDERVSRVFFWHSQIDPTESVNDGNNFNRVRVAIDPSAEGPNEYDQTQNLEIFMRWLGDGNESYAAAISSRLLNRYRDTPQQITFSYDAKDANRIVLGQPNEVTTRLIADETGASRPQQMQVTSIEEVVPNHVLKATAQTYELDGRYGFITENSRPDYSASTDAQRLLGTYIVDETTLVFPDGTGPYIMF